MVKVCGFRQSALQSFKCMCGAWTHTVCAHIKLTFHLHHALYSCSVSVFTALWCGCSVVKVTFYLHQTSSWLWLVWTNSPVFTPPRYGPVGTTVQMMPRLHCIWSIVDTCQVREYPDSTISTVLKWQMIMTLNRKLLKEQRVEPLCFLWGHTGDFFAMSMLLLVLQIIQPCLYSGLKVFTGLTNWQTDRWTKPNPFAHTCARDNGRRHYYYYFIHKCITKVVLWNSYIKVSIG